jgi:hypothetical protein
MTWILAMACQQEPAPPPPAPPPARSGAEPELLARAPATARRETYLDLWQDERLPRSAADGGGTLRLVDPPEHLVAGQLTELVLELEVGEHGIAEGGAIVLLGSPFWGWSPPQAEQEGAAGYTTVTGPDGASFALRTVAGMLYATVQGRALAAGERVRLVYGAGGTARCDRFAERSPLWLGIDGDGDGVRSMLSPPPTVEVLPGPAARLLVTLPSAVEPGQPFELALAAVDAVGNGPVPLQGELKLRASGPLSLPEQVRLQDGTARLTARADAPGLYVVAVQGPGELVASSNPMVVRAGAVPIRWADLQVHTALSDGTGQVDAVYRYAREVAALDAVALTDHDHFGPLFLDRHPEIVALATQAVDRAYEPGRFVTVHGYEWTSWLFGHRHVLGFAGPLPLASSQDPQTDTPEELHAALRDRPDVLVVRHHPAGGPVPIDWSLPVDPQLEPVVEIASVHGQSESSSLPGAIYDAVPEAFVDLQLAGGARFGLIGSTDGHDGHPGWSQLAGGQRGQGGLAALEGAELTRESMLATLRARRVYATNGPRIVLRFTVDGQPMGSTLAPQRPVEVELRVVGTAPLDRAELVTRAGVMGSRRGDGSALLHATWTLEPPAGPDLVYVRVVQQDGGLAWSSPVFLEPAR